MAKERMVEFGGKIPYDAYEEFRTNFPQYGATNWLINEAVLQMNSLIRANPQYRDIVSEAVKNAIRFPLYGVDNGS